ncbi:hypothetical protein [Ancylobacter sp. SL191]|uniref:hypothetical protein n=1 Tax=Ancylobacter sp. SL191 TaxID=2995166 RepID=UPI00226E25FF|nr:hypothetical protein [Ancylobacter sp. SL191]WAC25875.1 hypothetical protein OU996_12660 [Ancylobacter sp. SL191]
MFDGIHRADQQLLVVEGPQIRIVAANAAACGLLDQPTLEEGARAGRVRRRWADGATGRALYRAKAAGRGRVVIDGS